ncbi:MAG: class II glutamine amidotransferase, partial [Myxococcales bacterium]
MSASLAIYTSDPNLLKCQVAFLQRHVRLAEDRPPASVGLAFEEANSVLLRKKPGNVGSPDVVEMLADVRSDIVLYHLQSGSPGQFLEENAMPLRFRRWMFSQ